MKSNRQTNLEEYFSKLQNQRIKKQNISNKQQPEHNKTNNILKPSKNIKKQEKSQKQQKQQKQKKYQQKEKQQKQKKQKKQQKQQKELNEQKQLKELKQKSIELSVSGSQVQQAFAGQILKNKQKQRESLNQKNRMLNVQFYQNKINSEPSGDLIEKIHANWWGNYQLLQQHHGFIQWLFPNSFQSRFNRLASPLLSEQAKQFRNNSEIAIRYQKSYKMILQFYGMKLKNNQTGQITRCRYPQTHVNLNKKQKQTSSYSDKRPFFQQRYYKTLLTSFHNHMRITRILSSLVMCGFGRYAKELSLFLNEQINGQKGALKGLKRYGVYEREWKQYSELVQNSEDISILLKKNKD